MWKGTTGLLFERLLLAATVYGMAESDLLTGLVLLRGSDRLKCVLFTLFFLLDCTETLLVLDVLLVECLTRG